MKIIRLYFENLHSLKGKNEILFGQPPLSECGIFAIVGPTGSGKSTILDAITLALYSQTPRMGGVNKNIVENYGAIITRNTNDCIAELDYEINNERYRSRWEISRTKTGTMRDYSMEISKLPDGEIISASKSEVPKKNAEIIGLTYDQFVKSIVLSQGEFAKFLKSNADERGVLLEKITGTEIYRKIGKAAFERKKIEEQKLQNLKIQVDAIKILNQSEIDTLKESLIDLESALKEQNLQLNNYNTLFNVKQSIVKISNDATELNSLLENHILAINGFKSELHSLEIHEKLFPLKEDINFLNLKKTEVRKINQKKIDAVLLKEKLETQFLQLSNSLSELKLEFATSNTNHETQKPTLNLVKELDAKILVDKNLLNNEKQNLDKKTSDIKQLEFESNSIREQLNLCSKEYSFKENWLINNAVLDKLNSELLSIKEKVDVIKKLKTAIQGTQKYFVNEKFKEVFSDFSDLSKTILLIQNIENSISLEINALKKGIKHSGRSISELHEGILILREKHQKVNEQIRLAVELSDKKNKISELETNLSVNIDKIDKYNSDKIQINNDLEIIKKYIEELTIRFERQKLEAKYSDDRKKLEKDQPCFLCGSTHHPYIQNYESTIDNTKSELNKKEAKRKTMEALLNDIEKRVAQANSENLIFESNLKSLKNESSKILDSFREINELFRWTLLPDNLTELKIKLDSIVKEGKEVKEEIDCLEKIKILESDFEKISGFKEKVYELFDLISDFESLVFKYQVLVGTTNDDNSILVLENALTRFNTERIEYQNLLQQKTLLEQSLLEKIRITEKGLLEWKELNASFQQKKISYDELVEHRKSLLGELKPDVIEKEFADKLKTIDAKILHNEKQYSAVESQMAVLLESLINLDAEIEMKSKEVGAIESKLLPKIVGYGFSTPDEILKKILDEKIIQGIKEKKQKLDETKISLEQSYKDKIKELTELQKSDVTNINIGLLQKQIADIKHLIEQNNQNIGAIRNKLSENELNQSLAVNIHKLFEQQDKEFQRWNSLNELIGDRDGKTYSKFAQELTLIQLVGLANQHLKKLTPRYLIKKSESELKRDNLIVIDTYLANSERSVQTLSGGESFLVSLALALGLSDLAGHNTRIESLFIDEGFGSLDPQSLDLALAALDELQNHTQRTIGVISHVQALKERIPTQIELKKISAGYSTIEIR